MYKGASTRSRVSGRAGCIFNVKYAVSLAYNCMLNLSEKKIKYIHRLISSCSFIWYYCFYSETLTSGRKFKLKVQRYFSHGISCFFFQDAFYHSEVQVLSYKTLNFHVEEMKRSKLMRLKRQWRTTISALRIGSPIGHHLHMTYINKNNVRCISFKYITK